MKEVASVLVGVMVIIASLIGIIDLVANRPAADIINLAPGEKLVGATLLYGGGVSLLTRLAKHGEPIETYVIREADGSRRKVINELPLKGDAK